LISGGGYFGYAGGVAAEHAADPAGGGMFVTMMG